MITEQENTDIFAKKREWTSPVQTILASRAPNKIALIAQNKYLQNLFSFSLTAEHAEYLAQIYNARQKSLGCSTYRITGASRTEPVIEDSPSRTSSATTPPQETTEAAPSPFHANRRSSHHPDKQKRAKRLSKDEIENAYQQGDRSRSLIGKRSPEDFWAGVDAWHDNPVRNAKTRKDVQPLRLPSGATISIETARNWFDAVVNPEGFQTRTVYRKH